MKCKHKSWKFTSCLGIIILLLTATLFTHCSKEQAPAPEVKNSAKQITSFVFLLTTNPIDANVVGIINEETKTITASMPLGTNINGLVPEIEISNDASVSPKTPQDFTNPVQYTVTAEDASKTVYTVTVTVPRRSDKQMTSFVFLLTENPIDQNIIATINAEDKTIIAAFPPGPSITGLIPAIEISPGATVSPNTAQDFTRPVEYTISAEDGSTVIYTATVNQGLSQRQILQVLMDANPESSFDWDLINTSDLGTLRGVTTDIDGNIIELYLQYNRLTHIPPEIAQLTHLTSLGFPENRLTSLPAELSQLTNLKSLELWNNDFTSVPPVICQLTNLTKLLLNENEITSLPTEFWQLTELNDLRLNNNQLTSIPAGIGFMTKLTSLSLHRNKLTSIASEAGLLTNLETLSYTTTS